MERAMLTACFSILGLIPLVTKKIWYDVSLYSSPKTSGTHVPENMYIRSHVSAPR